MNVTMAGRWRYVVCVSVMRERERRKEGRNICIRQYDNVQYIFNRIEWPGDIIII